MGKKSFLKSIKNDPVYRCKAFLIVSTIWTGLQFLYYLIVDILTISWTYINNEEESVNFFMGFCTWFLLLLIFKIILLAKSKQIYKDKHIDFKKIAMIYLIIDVVLVWTITITPQFFTTMYASKIQKGFTIASLVSCTFNMVLFVLSLKKVKPGLKYNEENFIHARNIIGRTEGLFTVLLIAINIMLLLEIPTKYIGYVYFGIGLGFTIAIIVTIVFLAKARKKEQKNKKQKASY